ncbi:MAG: inverse autotransporter beta domain-containing protein [Candidatus Pelagibacter sp.]
MRIFFLFILFLTFSQSVLASEKQNILDKLAGQISEFAAGLMPGEGISEVSISLPEDDDVQIRVLGLRDISSDENSNLFTQFSLGTQEINNKTRYVTNIGLGNRVLNEDKSMMLGTNAFWDYDFEGEHARISLGLEAKASMLDFTANRYQKITNMKKVASTEEQVITGTEFNLTSQLPYMPWAKINWQNYYWENEKATEDTKGNEISLEMLLSPTLTFEVSGDFSDIDSVDDEYTYGLTFNYPPKENSKTMQDGMIAAVAFEKENMERKLREKVRRSNNLAVEVQGSIIVTSK